MLNGLRHTVSFVSRLNHFHRPSITDKTERQMDRQMDGHCTAIKFSIMMIVRSESEIRNLKYKDKCLDLTGHCIRLDGHS